ncbi:MAG: RNA polymerase sigma factor SigZ [Crocinitomicaceae bacterium]|nr:RNA polymerase sigma factor SigZ [Crocinitomicaceae bacterium]|tara:strand:- start:5678 stop:6211 length:534 start_codon:yes stop_codon:yes gene_type:complete
MNTSVIWKNFGDELLGFVQSRVNNKAVAEDILQDVFLKIHLNEKSLTNKDQLVSWIYQITRNTIIDYYRKKKWEYATTDFEKELPLEVGKLSPDFSRCLNSFIKELPDKYSDALEKTSYGNLSQKQYAEKLGLSYSATKSRVQRARKKLKELFVACCKVEADSYGNIMSSTDKNCNC